MKFYDLLQIIFTLLGIIFESLNSFYSYEMNLEIYREHKNTVNTVFDEGKLETAKSFKKIVVPIETIIEANGLTKEEKERFLKQQKL